ncbi:MAG: molybdopterin-dependent oxidoreductase [Chlorobi bacterium]|nr:molybdopterin-dependent oxidoreductase [Chlorobiota bacterium]
MLTNKPKELPESNQYGTAKLPPGQLYTEKFPVMTYGPTPIVEKEHWGLHIHGLVSEEKKWNWEEFMALPQTTLKADFHCVTHWSRFDDDWTGVLFKDFWTEIQGLVSPDATHVMQHAYGGYRTNLPLTWMLEEDVMFAHSLNREPLPTEHGGPLRIFTPKRYGWKGAKWIESLEFMPKDKPGFWEQNGYSNSANPWNEERYWE